MNKKFNSLTVLALAAYGLGTGTTFGDVHEAITWVLGHEVWTHELAEEGPWKTAGDAVREACPNIVPWAEKLRAASGNVPECESILKEFQQGFPLECELPKGAQDRTESPVSSLSRIKPDASVVVVYTGDGSND